MQDTDATELPPESASWPQLPGYLIEGCIGRGGMATVYRARQLSLDRPVAIKVMAAEASENPGNAARFEHEARIIARLEHPGIVGIHEVGHLQDGRLYYVMPHLPNGDLASRDLRTDETRIVAILRVLLDALGHAHAHGIVHRDVKPENVLFDAAGNPRLADFGIAIGRRRSAPRITREGMALGSSGYMAPEQARGEDIDGRADLYSVGILAFEMLTGRLPFEAEDELTLALMHAQDPLPALPESQRRWQRFLDKAAAKWPEQRYADAAAMQRGLDRIERAVRQSQRGWIGRMLHPQDAPRALFGAFVLAVLLPLVAWLWWPRDTAPTPDERGVVAPEPLEARIATANAQLAAGALVVPAGANAAESYLAVLREQPGRADAMNGLQRVFAGLADLAAGAVERTDYDAAREIQQQTELLADGLGALGQDGQQQVNDGLRRALEVEVSQALALADRQRVERALAQFDAFRLDASTVKALVARAAAGQPPRPVPGRDVNDPSQVTPPGPRYRSVTVAEYRRFAEATARAPTRCRARLSPLQLLDKRDWRDPGFPQNDAAPVVCVSHADAEAFATWLSADSGIDWRLPTLAERQAAGIDSSVEEWTRDCPPGDAGRCNRRLVFDAEAQRDGRADVGVPREAARGFAETGIRLVAGR